MTDVERDWVEVSLSNGAVAIVDAEDGWVRCWAWFIDRGGYVFRSTKSYGRQALHRTVLGLGRGDPPIDHRDGDKLNNRRSNLRVAGQAQNCQNVRSRGGTSEHRGVFFDAQHHRWRAQVGLNYKNVYLGSFDTELEAAAAAESFRREHLPYATG